MGFLTSYFGGKSGGGGGGGGGSKSGGGFLSSYLEGRGEKKREDSSAGMGTIDSDVVRKGYKRGGKVRKTGQAMLHKGEEVLTSKQAKRYRKRSGKRR